MGNCPCKRTLKTPDQATADPETRELTFVGENSLAHAPADADTHSVLGTPEEESPVVRNKKLQK